MNSKHSLRILFLILPTLLLLSSCFSLYFDQPQPKGGIQLLSVPEDLQGFWVKDSSVDLDTDTVYIDATGQYSFVFDSLAKVYRKEGYFLSDSMLLFKAGDYYVANLSKDGIWWEVEIIELKENGDICLYYPKTAPYFGRGRGLKVLKIVQEYDPIPLKDHPIGRERRVVFRRSLGMKNVYSREAVYYEGQFRIKDIEKVVIQENLAERYTFDGKWITPSQTDSTEIENE